MIKWLKARKSGIWHGSDTYYGSNRCLCGFTEHDDVPREIRPETGEKICAVCWSSTKLSEQPFKRNVLSGKCEDKTNTKNILKITPTGNDWIEHTYVLNGVDLTKTFVIRSMNIDVQPGGVTMEIRFGEMEIEGHLEKIKTKLGISNEL